MALTNFYIKDTLKSYEDIFKDMANEVYIPPVDPVFQKIDIRKQCEEESPSFSDELLS